MVGQSHLETLTANVTGKVRLETYLGREYLIAPLRLIVPGVLPGSKGPLLYTANEVAKHVHQWNGVPLVAPNHPTVNGTPVSARHPKVMEKYGIGFVYNAKANNTLDAEGWFDKEWTRRVDSRILTALTKGTKLELSTGLFTTDIPSPAGSKDAKGVTYNAEATAHKPDHVAILTDSIGACSIASGCGVLVNQRVTPYHSDSLLALNELGGDDMAKRTIWQRLGVALGLVDNELAHSDIRKALNQALQTRFGSYATSSSAMGTVSYVSCYVVDVFDDYVVYEEYTNGTGQSELYSLGYTVKDDVVTLSAEAPTSVQKVTSYKSVTGNSITDNNPSNTVITEQETPPTDNEAATSATDWDTGLVVNPYPNEHAARMANPDQFKKNSFRRKSIAAGISIIMGKKTNGDTMDVQAYRFDASKFTADQARKWLTDHHLMPMMFESAKTTNTTNNETSQDTDTTPISNSQGDNVMALTAEQKTQIVNGLVANCNCTQSVPWKGKDAATLNGLDDNTLAAYDQWNKSLTQTPTPATVNNGNQSNSNPTALGNRSAFIDNAGQCWMLNPTTNQLEAVRVIATAPINNSNQSTIPVAQPVTSPAHTPAPTGNSNKDKSMESWLANMPPQAQTVWNTAMETFNQQKANLVEQLTANMAGEAKDQATAIYNSMDVAHLRVLVAGLPVKQEDHNRSPVVNYFGAAGPVHSPVINEEPLLSPKYEFVLNGKK